MKEALLSGKTTSGRNLIKFFKAFDIKGSEAHGAEMLYRACDARQPVIALVAISGGSISSEGSTAHWIHIKEVKDQEIVVFYNPYTNKDETVDWDTFAKAWERVAMLSGNEKGKRLFITTATE